MHLRISFMFSYVSFLWMVQVTGKEGSMFPLSNNTIRLCVEDSMNSHHYSRLYLVFTAAIIALTFFQALVHLVLPRTPQNLLCGNKMLPISQCHPEDYTVKILKTTVLFYYLTVLGLWWVQTVFFCVILWVQQRLCSGKIPNLFKLMAVVYLQVYSPLTHHSLAKNCWGVLDYTDLHSEALQE